MAEILLSLTIIGVVAAITLPSLTGNINERTWSTQRKALHTRMVQAVAMMGNLNGFGTYNSTITEDDNEILNLTVSEDTAAETFVTAGLSKVLKLNNVCDNEHLADCGLATNISTMGGTQITLPKTLKELNQFFATDGTWKGDVTAYGYPMIDTKAAGFETANGESVAVYYNPRCLDIMQAAGSGQATSSTEFPLTLLMCANFVFDMNGNKGPNTVGKDIGFMSAVYSSEPQVAMPVLTSNIKPAWKNWRDGAKYCREQDARLPSLEEGMAIAINSNLLGLSDEDKIDAYWTNTLVAEFPSNAWIFWLWNGDLIGNGSNPNKDNSWNVLCVKR